MNNRCRVDLPKLMELVEEARWDRRMSWAEVAEEIGFERAYMSKLVNGAVDSPSSDRLLSLLHWLKLTDVELGRLVQRITVTKEDS